MNVPSCGVITKAGVSSTDQTLAMFWEYTVEEEYTVNIGVGDQVDLTNEAIIFQGNNDCEEFATTFEYIVDANMPVNGPTSSIFVR